MLNNILDWLKEPKNYLYLIIAFIGIIAGSIKYDFLSTIIVFAGFFILATLIGHLWK